MDCQNTFKANLDFKLLPEPRQLILEKLTTRNIIALSITGTVLTVILQMTFNAEAMLVIVKENAEWVVTGAFIFGALIAKFTDVIQFYFRKPQEKEGTA